MSLKSNVFGVIGKLFLIAGVISVSFLSLRYVSLEVVGILDLKSEDLLGNSFYRLGFYLHISGGIIAIISGISQFFKNFRSKNILTHRTLGKIYIIAVMVSGFAGLLVAPFAYGGWVSSAGFIALAVLWILATYIAYQHILNSNFDSHQVWMFRSYALCFTAVTLRIWLLVFPVFGLEYLEAYKVAAWMPWLLNLLIVEIYIRLNLSPKSDLEHI